MHNYMDQELIFPCSDNLWHVRKDIDDRIDSQRSLVDLNGKSILFPEQKQGDLIHVGSKPTTIS